MKFVVYAAIAASLFHIAAAVNLTMTLFTDANCTTAVASTADAPNPFFSAPLNVCARLSADVYVISKACGGGNMTGGGAFSDFACSQRIAADAVTATDVCLNASGLSVVMTCTSTSTTNLGPGPTSAPSPASTPVKTSPANCYSLQSVMPIFVAIVVMLYF
jgi:hypothetical protein